MKKFIAVLFAISFLCVSILSAHAFEFDKKNVALSAEYNNVEQSIDTVIPIGLGIFICDDPVLSASLSYAVDDVKLQQYLLNAAYKISDNFIPYILLGVSSLELKQNRYGSLATPYSSGSLKLTTSDFDVSGAFTYGIGVRGNLMTLPANIDLSYDIRTLRFDATDYTDVALIPDFVNFALPLGTRVEYALYSISSIASRTFEFDEEYLKALTPYVGYKYSHAIMNIKNRATYAIQYYPIAFAVDTEQNVKSDLHSLLVGVNAQINENWSASIGGSFFGETGFNCKVTYAF